MDEHSLWSVSNALFTIIFITLFAFGLTYAFQKSYDIKDINKNWAKHRCTPTIMPFASLFGHNTSENFQFCMGQIFSTHASSYLGSFSGILGHFTGILGMVVNSISSLRNIIASIGGGINVIFQEFTERISTFFFKIRVSAIHIKTLIGRMYAILFSVMYMGLSGITGLTTFTNTFLFSFLDVFCFPGDTLLNIKDKGITPIRDIKIGDIILPNSRVTGTFRFYSKGQPMVKIDNITVSTNHYIEYNNKYIKAGDHPQAIDIGIWNSDEPLYCLDTDNNKIPINNKLFLDYDETSDADYETMKYIEKRINGKESDKNSYKFTEYSPGFDEQTKIRTKSGIKSGMDIRIGDELLTGASVIGLIRREINEYCIIDNNIISPSTLYWEIKENKWIRIGEKYDVLKNKKEVISFITVPNSQIELENGLRIRDYMELCSPDSEMYYTEHLKG
jgi:hypothetical protein